MQRYFCTNLENNKFTLSLEDTYHITKVMRMKIGSIIEIVSDSKLYKAKIIELAPVKALIISEDVSYNELEKKVTICQSLVKESKMDLILQKGVELGAYSFIPLETRNSIIKIKPSDFSKKNERWQKIVRDASRQSKRNLIPQVLNIATIEEIVKLDYDLKILLTVNEMTKTLKNVLQNHKECDTIIIVIGPEGGFKKDEEEYLIKNGFISTSLGKLVLRTETASLATLSMINYEFER